MGTEESTLGMSLAEMWAVGQTYYPQMGAFYSALSAEAGITDNQGRAFERTTSVQGAGPSATTTTPGRVFPVWEEARDAFQQMLAKSGQNLYDTGTTVMRAAELYAHADREGQKEVEVAGSFDSQKRVYEAKPLDKVPSYGERTMPLPPS